MSASQKPQRKAVRRRADTNWHGSTMKTRCGPQTGGHVVHIHGTQLASSDTDETCITLEEYRRRQAGRREDPRECLG